MQRRQLGSDSETRDCPVSPSLKGSYGSCQLLRDVGSGERQPNVMPYRAQLRNRARNFEEEASERRAERVARTEN